MINNAADRATADATQSILVLRSLDTVSDGGTVAVIHHTGITSESLDGRVLMCVYRLRVNAYR
jgi:hypothetical protein